MLSVLSLAFLTSVQAQTITFTGDSWADDESGAIVTHNGVEILNSLYIFGAGSTEESFNISVFGEGEYVVTLLDAYGDGWGWQTGMGYVVDPTPFTCTGDCAGAFNFSGSEVTYTFALTSETP
ncbi:MAG: hypothetical protein P8M07_08545, partial [Flavobacteriales bacterium]|nr:hypothetical protein [Flavobacteriales bacterium]